MIRFCAAPWDVGSQPRSARKQLSLWSWRRNADHKRSPCREVGCSLLVRLLGLASPDPRGQRNMERRLVAPRNSGEPTFVGKYNVCTISLTYTLLAGCWADSQRQYHHTFAPSRLCVTSWKEYLANKLSVVRTLTRFGRFWTTTMTCHRLLGQAVGAWAAYLITSLLTYSVCTDIVDRIG